MDSLPQYLISQQEFQCHSISVFTRELLSLCGLLQREESRLCLQVKNKQGRCYSPNAPAHPSSHFSKGQDILSGLIAQTQEQETCM